jgi:hypothetical protein
MIEQFLVWLASQIPGLIVGALAGGVLVFFYIQHKLKSDPNWVENLYQKQRAVGMKGTDELDKLRSKIKELEMDKVVDTLKAEVETLKAKIKG